MTKGKSNKISSSHIRFGRRTYFFDVNEKNDMKYLKITESRFNGEGKDRTYNSLVLFKDDVEGFQKNLSEVSGYLS